MASTEPVLYQSKLHSLQRLGPVKPSLEVCSPEPAGPPAVRPRVATPRAAPQPAAYPSPMVDSSEVGGNAERRNAAYERTDSAEASRVMMCADCTAEIYDPATSEVCPVSGKKHH